MRGIAGYVRGASVMGAAVIASTGIALAGTSAHITSLTMSGTSAAPEVTVKGSGFGSRPAPHPSYPPEGRSGCPVEPAARAGHLYGTQLYFADLNAKKGSINDPGQIRSWTAGQASSTQFDCIGIVIDRWTSTRVRFHFGDVYGKFLPQNTYFLSNGDRVRVVVRGAGFLVARTRFR